MRWPTAGKRVIVAGLDQDYPGKPFEPMPQLLAVAEYITKTLAICMVLRRARQPDAAPRGLDTSAFWSARAAPTKPAAATASTPRWPRSGDSSWATGGGRRVVRTPGPAAVAIARQGRLPRRRRRQAPP